MTLLEWEGKVQGVGGRGSRGGREGIKGWAGGVKGWEGGDQGVGGKGSRGGLGMCASKMSPNLVQDLSPGLQVPKPP